MKKRAVRKPKHYISLCGDEYEVVKDALDGDGRHWVYVKGHLTKTGEMRRLAAWLIKAATYIESKNNLQRSTK